MSSYIDLLPKNLRTYMLANAGITGAVGTRVGPKGGFQNPTFPYIPYVCPLGGRAPWHTLGDNSAAARFPRFQIEGVATSYSQCVSVGAAIDECLEGATFGVTGWGVPRIEAETEPTIIDENVEGVKVYRWISRYKMVLGNQS